MNFNEKAFSDKMLSLGFVSYSEQARLLDVAKKCFMQMGVPLGGAGAVMAAGAGSVVIPGIGAVPGAVAGFLAGAATGTAACISVQYSMKDELKKLLHK